MIDISSILDKISTASLLSVPTVVNWKFNCLHTISESALYGSEACGQWNFKAHAHKYVSE